MLHQRVIILTVQVEELPTIDLAERIELVDEGHGFWRLVLHVGFMDEVDIPAELARANHCGGPFDMMSTSFFLGRQKLVAVREKAGMALWREHLFAWMMKASESAMDFFRLPTGRVVELGSQLRI